MTSSPLQSPSTDTGRPQAVPSAPDQKADLIAHYEMECVVCMATQVNY